MITNLIYQKFLGKNPKNIKEAFLTNSIEVYLLNKVLDLFAITGTIEEQRKTAVEIIRAGKENGLKEIEIELDQQAGLNIDATIKEFNLDSKIQFGKNGRMKIKLKYN